MYRIEDRVLIDHLVYAAPSLPAATADVAERFGVRAQAGGKHIGLGTHNALLALGPRTYLEIIAPHPGQPEPSMPRPFGLDRVSHGRLAGWALACDDIDAAVAGARGHGYDPGDVLDGRRVGPTGTALRWRMTADRRLFFRARYQLRRAARHNLVAPVCEEFEEGLQGRPADRPKGLISRRRA